MELSEIERLSVANSSYAIVTGRFADMLNPDMRGPNFLWTNFPEHIAKTCSAEIHIYFDSSEWTDDQHTLFSEAAERFGKEIAETLVKRAGFIAA